LPAQTTQTTSTNARSRPRRPGVAVISTAS
jgi:hypothetical protein